MRKKLGVPTEDWIRKSTEAFLQQGGLSLKLQDAVLGDAVEQCRLNLQSIPRDPRYYEVAGYLAYWIAKLKPIVVDGKENRFVNEACGLALARFYCEAEGRPLWEEVEKHSKVLASGLRYGEASGEVMASFILAMRRGEE